ncbi:CIC11C00000000035 [Sungouiella intermedia]|uniref:CIC11C00000000035 n=1 Tax=Sungouiella intermedia TaxID=45354 RepID=A0A1L0BF23_9ASCO|nr:CIC11C00000000035 [[Candida] intermedia]
MSQNNTGEVFQGGATTSQHVDAEDDDHFENTTFKLKRTRSLGLLDEFIDPEKQEQRIESHNAEMEKLAPLVAPSSTTTSVTVPDSTISDVPGTSSEEPPSQSSVTTPTPPFVRSPEMIPHDDSDLVAEPSRHVDYLSHQWDVEDISKSWRYVILRRKNVANAARLENASWRTWAQRRSHLKTISPEEVNWLKESDVTWLYGPIVDDDDHDHDHDQDHPSNASQTCNTASSVVAGDISIARKNHGPKPILKKRTVEDMMISHLNLLKLEVATARAEQEQRRREDAEAQRRREAQQKSGVSERPPEYFDYDVISAKLNSQYKNFSQQSSANNSAINLAAKIIRLLRQQTFYKTIHLLPPTTLNYGSSDEESDESNPYTSSLSHNVDNSVRGYDYYYDYNSVYQVDPNHAIYGAKKAPDVVDVPENITLGSNFDYEIIENENADNFDYAPLEIVGHSHANTTDSTAASGATINLSDRERLPISSLDDSAVYPVRPVPLSMDASDSSSEDEEEGLSIHTKNSSQSLAQLVFGGQGMTAAIPKQETDHFPKDFIKEREPEARHISEINPRYSSTELSKQPHSSSSLSDQFFSTGMTPAKNSALADLFFNTQDLPESTSSPLSPSYSGTQSPPVQPKSSPLPPHTTSANAFLGRSTPPLNKKESKKSFIFDSDSESEDEFIENVNPPSSTASNDSTTYASLYAVADRNGIPVSPPDSEENQRQKKGLAMANFLGSWNKGS